MPSISIPIASCRLIQEFYIGYIRTFALNHHVTCNFQATVNQTLHSVLSLIALVINQTVKATLESEIKRFPKDECGHKRTRQRKIVIIASFDFFSRLDQCSQLSENFLMWSVLIRLYQFSKLNCSHFQLILDVSKIRLVKCTEKFACKPA